MHARAPNCSAPTGVRKADQEDYKDGLLHILEVEDDGQDEAVGIVRLAIGGSRLEPECPCHAHPCVIQALEARTLAGLCGYHLTLGVDAQAYPDPALLFSADRRRRIVVDG